MSNLQKTVAEAFQLMADGLESGKLAPAPRIALTGMGSEHGEPNAIEAALAAQERGVHVVYIGSQEVEGLECVHVDDDEAGHAKMVELLDAHEIDGAVTMHFPFPIGVSTVGRAVTPARGREMLVATTTGTSSADLVEGMILNAVYGVIAAKASGMSDPSVGILNVNGARQCEMALKQLADGGYPLRFAESSRADGGCVLRGNDVLQATADVLVCDSLTGNVLTKMLSSYATGGSFEAVGSGYGPGIGRGYDKLVLIVSRASGVPVIANALVYAGELVRNHVFDVSEQELAAADAAGLQEILAARREASKPAATAEEVSAPPKEPVPSGIPGIDVMDLEDAVKVLWREKIYAESGMGCTGPIVLTSEANHERSIELLRKAGYVA
jgi:hypothetical protein